MLRKLCAIAVMAGMLAGWGEGFAQTTEHRYDVGATIEPRFTLGTWLMEVDSMGTPDPTDDDFDLPIPTAINFGTLVEDPVWGIYRPAGGHYFMVNLIASTSGRPYTIQHSMVSTGSVDADLALTATPIFSDALAMKYKLGETEYTKTNADLGYNTAPGTVGGKHLAVGDWPTYVSSSTGESLIIGEVWGIFDGDEANQTVEGTAFPLVVGQVPAMTISGSIMYTLVANF